MAGFSLEFIKALRGDRSARKLSWRLMSYVGQRFLASALVCYFSFAAMFLIAIVLDDLQSFVQHEASGAQIIAYLALFLPQYLVHALPMALHVGALFAVGSLSRSSELVAMSAAGVSIRQLILPIAMVAVVMAAVQFALVCGAPGWRARAVDIRESLTDPFDTRDNDRSAYLAYLDKLEQRGWLFQDFAPDGVCKRITVTQYRGDGTISWEIRAGKADFADGHWWFTDGEISHYDGEGYQLTGKPIHIPGRQPQKELVDDPRSFTMMVGLKVLEEVPIAKLIELLFQSDRPLAPTTQAALRAQLYAYLLSPLACIIAIILGVPIAIEHSRSRSIRNVLIGLSLMICYHLCVEIALVMGRLMIAPALLLAVVPPLLFLAGGCYALYLKR